MNIDTQDLSSYIPGYDDYVDDTKPVYSTKEYYDMKELLEGEIEDKEDEIERLHSIINEVREILKFHLSNPSGTKNGWHVDIWNNENISKLNEYLGILDKENK